MHALIVVGGCANMEDALTLWNNNVYGQFANLRATSKNR